MLPSRLRQHVKTHREREAQAELVEVEVAQEKAEKMLSDVEGLMNGWLPAEGARRVISSLHDAERCTLRSMLLAALMTYSLASGLTLTLRSPDVAISALLQRLTGSYLHQLVQ